MEFHHQTVLENEAVDLLNVRPGDHVIDGTLGGGGHAEVMLKKISPDGKLLGIDLDSEAIQAAEKRLQKYKKRINIVQDNFANIKKIYEQQSCLCEIRAILLDLGASRHQFRSKERGFSFLVPGPLDMRFQKGESEDFIQASHIVNTWKEDKLRKIFQEYGEERFPGRIARMIVEYRKKKKITTTTELAEIVSKAYPRPAKFKLKIHPATKVFQALRIAVNDELSNLTSFLPDAIDILQPGGRLAIITFHSLEDRIVKNFFRQESKDCLCPSEFPVCRCGHVARLKVVTKKPIVPQSGEQQTNHSARSAKLRVAEKK